MLNSKILAAALGLGLVGLAGAASASIVTNGSFEIGTEALSSPGWTIYGSGLPGWTTTSGGIEVQTAGTVGLTPYDGAHYVEMDGNNNYTISQNVTLGVGRYSMSFAYSPRMSDAATNDVNYGVSGLFSGTVVGPSLSAGTAVGAWTVITTNFFVKTAGAYALSFAGAGTDDSLGGFVDAVSIAAVPVPAGGLLLLGALGGIAALRRRKSV